MSDNASGRRRSRRSPGQWARLVETWSSSGLPAHEYAKREGIGIDSLYRWAGRLRREDGGRVGQAAGAPPEPARPRFLAVEVAGRQSASVREGPSRGAIEVSWPGGPVVRVSGEVAAETVAAVLRTMAEVAAC